MDDKQLAKLIRKNAAKAARPSKLRPAKKYDPTLQNREETDEAAEAERTQLFKDMKKREF
jgi:hypothetical protein